MRRNYLDIYVDILKAAMTGAKKSHIVFKANLNFKIVRRYLDRLIDNGMLSPADDSRLYTTTDRGVALLDIYNELVAPIKPMTGREQDDLGMCSRQPGTAYNTNL